MEQIFDTPVPRTLAGGGLHGFSPGQSSAQRIVGQNVGLPVPDPPPSRGFPPGQGSQRRVQQITDIIARVLVEVFLVFTLTGFHSSWRSPRRGDEELEARLEAEPEELLAISPDLSPQRQARFTEVLRELERLLAQDALHPGLYDQEVSKAASLLPRSSSTTAVVCSWLVLLVKMHLTLCSFVCRQAVMKDMVYFRIQL